MKGSVCIEGDSWDYRWMFSSNNEENCFEVSCDEESNAHVHFLSARDPQRPLLTVHEMNLSLQISEN